MKTQINKQGTIKAILLAIAIALFSPTLNAQRRGGNEESKSQKVEQRNNRESNRSSKPKKEYRRAQPKQNHETFKSTNKDRRKGDNQKKSTYQYKNKQNKQHLNKHQSNKYVKHGHKKNNYKYHKPIHVNIHTPVYSYWDIHDHSRHNISFRKIPRKSILVYLDGESYLLYKRKFYQANYWGFYRVNPPRYVEHLPEGSDLVIHKGYQLFNFHGILFIDTPLGYKIINS
ncbi:MAG: hypothetical protein PF541_08085 [Prolixibacteraceae bacterium]|jgi:hypothetical protein|nr:hypothetical protein [Prolixibacteraceae bacterium]